MLKRMLTLLTILTLFPLAALAETVSPLYRLVLEDEAGQETLLGSGIAQMADNLLLTVRAACQARGALYAEGPDGRFPVEERFLVDESSGLVLLALSGAEGKELPPAAQPQLPLLCRGLRRDGTEAVVPAEHVAVFMQDRLPYLAFSAEEGLLPGAVLMDEAGALAGIVTAVYGEGVGRYAALSIDGIYALLVKSQQETEAADASWLTGFTVTPKDGGLLVDWSHCTIDGKADDSRLEVFLTAEGNPYYSFAYAEPDAGSMMLAAAPGRAYQVSIRHIHGEGEPAGPRSPNAVVSAAMPEAQPFTLYGYQDSACYLGSLPAGQTISDTGLVPPLEAITAQALSSPDTVLYLQTVSHYAALDTQAEAHLLFVLTTPEDEVFIQEGGFIFDPTLAMEDAWHADVSALFADYLSLNNTGDFSPGTYTLSYYLDGALGSQFTFTLD